MNEANLQGSMALYGSPQFNTLNLTGFGFNDEQILELDADYRANLTKINTAKYASKGYDDVTILYSGEEEPDIQGFGKTKVIENNDKTAKVFAIFANVDELDIDL